MRNNDSFQWTGRLYSLYRAALGCYLLVHFGALLPWGTEVFSSSGVLPQAKLSPLAAAFPSILLINDDPLAVGLLLASLVAAALLFAVGWKDRAAGVWIWYGLACLFTRNPLTANPSLPFVGWLMVAHAFVPPGPQGFLDGRSRPELAARWRMPRMIPVVAWIVMAVAYSYSGCMKLSSPSWIDGTALAEVLQNPLARPTFLREWILAAPMPLLQVATWSALALEVFFAPMALFKPLRPPIWLAMVGMHAGLLILVDFADLTLGMVFIHMLTVPSRWLLVADDYLGRRFGDAAQSEG